MSSNATKPWTFVTSHGQVLLCLAQDPEMRLRDVADRVGITERAAQRIVTDLVEAGYVDRTRIGRRNRYSINPTIQMRHEAQQGRPVGSLLQALLDERANSTPANANPKDTPPQNGNG
jgi:DNA-binding IclR family transcriptional regulator